MLIGATIVFDDDDAVAVILTSINSGVLLATQKYEVVDACELDPAKLSPVAIQQPTRLDGKRAQMPHIDGFLATCKASDNDTRSMIFGIGIVGRVRRAVPIAKATHNFRSFPLHYAIGIAIFELRILLHLDFHVK